MGDVLDTDGKCISRPPAEASSRVLWIDCAKALAVVLVVVYHVAAGMDFLFAKSAVSGSGFWADFNQIVVPLRMPLFFVVAGLLAQTSIVRPWNAVIRPRVTALIWPYVLWTVAFAFLAGLAYRPDNLISFAIERLQGLPFARLGYWFLLVLPAFFVAAKLLRRWAPVLLGVTFALAVAAPWLEAHVLPSMHWLTIYGTTRVARYAFWYFLGCYAFRYVDRVRSLHPVLLFSIGGAAFIALTCMSDVLNLSAQFGLVLSVAGVTAMVGLSAWLGQIKPVQTAATYLAKRTLPIYLIHPMLVVLVIVIARPFVGAMQANDVLPTLLVPIVAVLSIATSSALYDRIRPTRAAWIFAPPAWVDRVSHRASRPRR